MVTLERTIATAGEESAVANLGAEVEALAVVTEAAAASPANAAELGVSLMPRSQSATHISIAQTYSYILLMKVKSKKM